jgi:hypothetical protein
VTNRLPTDKDVLEATRMTRDLFRKISTDVSITNNMSRKPVTYFRQLGEIHIDGVEYEIQVTARYPGWEEYIQTLRDEIPSDEMEDNDEPS